MFSSIKKSFLSNWKAIQALNSNFYTNLQINTQCDLPCYGLHVAKNSRWLELAPFVYMLAGYLIYYTIWSIISINYRFISRMQKNYVFVFLILSYVTDDKHIQTFMIENVNWVCPFAETTKRSERNMHAVISLHDHNCRYL